MEWLFPWRICAQLRKRGVLGMNERNHAYIGRYNNRALYPLVDNKLVGKQLAIDAGIAVPQLLHVVRTQHEAMSLRPWLEQWSEFVIKPAKGSGGKGILVVTGRDGDRWLRVDGYPLSLDDIERHVSNTLGGLYSLGGNTDCAMIESLVQADPVFESFSYGGVPDIRTVVFQGYPVMAMVRLTTARSGGKANLHQGAVGVGLDLAHGTALSAVQMDHPISSHPDTGNAFANLQVPGWSRVLELSASCFEMTGLGYIGVDIVLDRERGPLILELNARPGLAIQIANNRGLLPRLRHVEALGSLHSRPQERVDYVRSTFTAAAEGAEALTR
ncbi:MAG: alpha-L-glutamate ligase-like protein [Kistimonas sp.]|nr:alpha-L-glutamate ligase-like protein [Kistimonas sp.]